VIPQAKPVLGEDEIEAVTAVLRGGMLVQGARVAELEERWAAYIGTRHAVAVSNGTVALMAIWAGLGLGQGDEVITSAFTFNATASAILSTGATPVFVDIDPVTYNLDPTAIDAAITPRTRAICPVHLYGLPADMDPILGIAERHGFLLVEDACQAHGASYRGRMAGSFGPAAFSLYATKNLTTGEGGLITTNDDSLARFLRLYRNQGMERRYHHEILGYNLRLTDLQAAIGLVQLDKLERHIARRRELAACYDAMLAGLPATRPVTPDGHTHAFHQYTLRVGPARDAIAADMSEAGVGTAIYYPIPLHRQAYIIDLGIAAELPTTDAAAATVLSLPMHPGLTDAEQEHVVSALAAALARHGGEREAAA